MSGKENVLVWGPYRFRHPNSRCDLFEVWNSCVWRNNCAGLFIGFWWMWHHCDVIIALWCSFDHYVWTFPCFLSHGRKGLAIKEKGAPSFTVLHIFKFHLLGIVNKLPNLKVSSSMIKKVYLTWFLLLLGKLAPSYQVLNVDVQFSHGLVLGLFDVWQIFILAW